MFDMIFSLTGGCPESHYCPLGTTDPIACPAGTYNDLTHQKICKSCEPGYYCVANSTTYLSTPCPTGKKKSRRNEIICLHFIYPYQILQILWAWGSGIVPHGQMLKNVMAQLYMYMSEIFCWYLTSKYFQVPIAPVVQSMLQNIFVQQEPTTIKQWPTVNLIVSLVQASSIGFSCPFVWSSL